MISVDATPAAVLSELDCILKLKEKEKTLKAFLSRKDLLLCLKLALARLTHLCTSNFPQGTSHATPCSNRKPPAAGNWLTFQ